MAEPAKLPRLLYVMIAVVQQLILPCLLPSSVSYLESSLLPFFLFANFYHRVHLPSSLGSSRPLNDPTIFELSPVLPNMPLNAQAIYPASDPEFVAFPSRRSVVHSTKGIVSSSQPLASNCGLRVLQQGGNCAVSRAAAVEVRHVRTDEMSRMPPSQLQPV